MVIPTEIKYGRYDAQITFTWFIHSINWISLLWIEDLHLLSYLAWNSTITGTPSCFKLGNSSLSSRSWHRKRPDLSANLADVLISCASLLAFCSSNWSDSIIDPVNVTVHYQCLIEWTFSVPMMICWLCSLQNGKTDLNRCNSRKSNNIFNTIKNIVTIKIIDAHIMPVAEL